MWSDGALRRYGKVIGTTRDAGLANPDRSQFGQQLTELEDHAHMPAAMAFQSALPHTDDVLPRYFNFPLRRADESQHAAEQRALAAAAGPNHRSRLARTDLKVHAVQQHAISDFVA